ncbi:GNAT family N-acetyltransferase [Streptomyces sp. A7024]|uniref:GNAT family N-acetyltransferase n=1 Tax=Streptomyces coryli TaxID=1128680 RepID=A0A6G4TW99_9ACTN|nr:GNAT family N-acetyltransferase [Streptomyces coryli]NGN64052.1 GNAT family N-acetyltransferase [Streptomyces coryli]
MIEIAPDRIPALARRLPPAAPGVGVLAEHVAAGGAGQWWADDAEEPRAMAVACAGHLLLRGDPAALDPAGLAPFAGHHVHAPARFLPLLGSAFDRVVPSERMTYLHQVAEPQARSPRGITVRRLTAADADAVAALGPDAGWVSESWGGPAGLAGSGFAHAAVRKGAVLAVACTYFRGSAYEDVACYTAPADRRRGLAKACVTALCRDIAGRGATATWTCGRDNRPSRLLAWYTGFRLHDEYDHYATGRARGLSGDVPRPVQSGRTATPDGSVMLEFPA